MGPCMGAGMLSLVGFAYLPRAIGYAVLRIVNPGSEAAFSGDSENHMGFRSGIDCSKFRMNLLLFKIGLYLFLSLRRWSDRQIGQGHIDL